MTATRPLRREGGEPGPAPFDFFEVRVRRIEDLSPSFRRFEFEGPALGRFADPGPDQRIKLVLPAARGGYAHLPRGLDWYKRHLSLAEDERCTIRTYTTRAVLGSGEDARVLVDVVRHGTSGPAGRWCEAASVGDEVVLLGPNTDFSGERGGVDFLPPRRTGAHLIGGDETAAPAIARILETLPASARGIAVVELPLLGDLDYIPRHPGIEARVFARGSAPRGERLIAEVATAAAELHPEGAPVEVEEIDVDARILWEVPRSARGGAALASTDLYAWLAGEATAVRAMRRGLVSGVGVDRRSVAFMGYWREGRPEG